MSATILNGGGYERAEIQFTGKHGSVRYTATKFPHNCGIVVISNPRFSVFGKEENGLTITTNLKKLYLEFDEHLSGGNFGNAPVLQRARLMMSDKENGTVHKFCQNAKYDWWMSEGTKNPNSGGNTIYHFWRDRKS